MSKRPSPDKSLPPRALCAGLFIAEGSLWLKEKLRLPAVLRCLLCLMPSLLNKPTERFPNDFIRKSLLERQASPSSSPTTNPWLPALDYLSWDTTAEGLALPSGSAQLNAPSPLSMFYAGHQFGQFNPALGDGRAILIGELVDGEGTIRYSIKRKWTNPTLARWRWPIAARTRDPRIFNVEFMFYAGVPTSGLAAISTGDPVYRERGEPGGVLTRVTSSHIRFGTFQYFAARGDDEALQRLTDYVIARHYSDCQDTDRPALALLEQVMQRTAALIAAWQGLTAIHGVMNTDNMLICGETIDYGPCAMMDGFRINRFSSIDHAGRYAYHQQPSIGQWNLMALADALLPIIDQTEKKPSVSPKASSRATGPPSSAFTLSAVRQTWFGSQRRKRLIVPIILEIMQQHHLDFTGTFIELESIRFNGLRHQNPCLLGYLAGLRR